MQCGVELHSSLTLALPRTVKVTLAFSVPTVKVTRALLSAPQRWEDDGNPPTLPHSGHGVRYLAPPWWLPPTHSGHGVRYLAPPWWLPPTLSLSPPHANTEGSAVARRE